MLPSIQTYASRIDALYPGLDLSAAQFDAEGSVNAVVMVDDLVFRFARDERSVRTLARELTVLDRICDRLPLPIPSPIHREIDLIVYRKVPGVPLRNTYLRGNSTAIRQVIATGLGSFYRLLHATDASGIAPTTAPVTYEAQVRIREDVREWVYPHLVRHQIDGAEELFSSMLSSPDRLDFEPKLIHGDVMPYHLLVDADKGCMSGIIDFGVAGVGDPASDIAGLLLAYGESFVRLMSPAYPELTDLLRRARYRAQVLELAWTMQGLKHQNSFWFGAHLGGARDLDSE